MGYTHISLNITEWIGSYGTRYHCTLFTDYNGKADMRRLTLDEANIAQWELLKKGAKKTESYNPYSPHIHTREIRLIQLD